MKNKLLFFAIIIIFLSTCCISGAISYKNNLVHYISKQRNKIPSKSYTPPGYSQRDMLRDAVTHILAKEYAQAESDANFAGYSVKSITHTNSSVYYILESKDPKRRPWGTYVFYLADDKEHFVIEVPHPVTEKNTSMIGIKSFIDSKAASFLMSGSRERAFSGSDVTLNPDSVFQAVHEAAASETTTIVLQIHGFNKRKYPQIVLTSGTSVAISAMDGLVDELIQQGFDTGIYNGVQYVDYGATQNEQGKYTNGIGGSFIGVYLNRPVHQSKKESNKVILAIKEYVAAETGSETTTSETS